MATRLGEVNPNRRRRAHWLRLTGHVDLPDACGRRGCWRWPTRGFIEPLPDGDAGVLTVVCCEEDLRWSVEWTRQISGQRDVFRLRRLEAARVDGAWWRPIDYREAVVTAGAVVCERCTAQALYLTAGVDHGVPDKWWPTVRCYEHAQEHAVYNGASLVGPWLRGGEDNFDVVAEWDGSTWRDPWTGDTSPLPWPLRAPSPADLGMWVASW